jgi:hypothetical protein
MGLDFAHPYLPLGVSSLPPSPPSSPFSERRSAYTYDMGAVPRAGTEPVTAAIPGTFPPSVSYS